MRNSIIMYRWVVVGLIILTVVAWTSSIRANAQARILFTDNQKLTSVNSDLGHNLSQARYELQNAQRDCVGQIEEVLYKFGGKDDTIR